MFSDVALSQDKSDQTCHAPACAGSADKHPQRRVWACVARNAAHHTAQIRHRPCGARTLAIRSIHARYHFAQTCAIHFCHRGQTKQYIYVVGQAVHLENALRPAQHDSERQCHTCSRIRGSQQPAPSAWSLRCFSHRWKVPIATPLS